MSIKNEYFNYLVHFGSTVKLSEFAKMQGAAIALRHDIDHSIDVALEMAYWEHRRDIQATYFILDTADYFQDPALLQKCLQIQSFGHEIGLHLNAIARWFETGKDPYLHLKEQLQYFRDAGINVYGTSAHGDRSCYKNNFINYWLFQDLKVKDVAARESCLNAEGIYESDEIYRIKYPANHYLESTEGERLHLWQKTQADYSLDYEASHLNYDAYFSDSGGSWKRSPDPLGVDLKDKRAQVLIHPIHWRAPRKIFFFLSTARSGSKWLASLLDEASSCGAQHEYSLNHFDCNNVAVNEKMTGLRLHELLKDNKKIEEGLSHTRRIVDESDTDYAEANVYLPLVVDQLEKKFPDANLVHLHRDPADVVRSIMNRGWYDTPFDTSHPADLDKDWAGLLPFEKCCAYVATINSRIMGATNQRIDLRYASYDFKYIEKKLSDLGIAFYPDLAKGFIDNKINSNKVTNFPAYGDWNSSLKLIYRRRLLNTAKALGYFAGAYSMIDSLSYRCLLYTSDAADE